ncbi:MAG TPA: 23S rRNA (adenine(2503)-C(2))-methyltransferase RlmN [Terriglobales bacterium]|nr:23S rRNA (adenine(2503)-C(2))-methyltransferase RlmN [Terriglobales bacterium]
MKAEAQRALLGLDIQELTALVENSGEPAYRGRQLFQAIYSERLESPQEISTLPQEFRRRLLEQGYAMGHPSIEKRFVSADGTVRYLMSFGDGESVETVWMPEGDQGEAGDGSEAGDEEEKGRERQRATICVSSQVGCAVGCEFCLTAQLGVKRNLTAGEIVGQIIAVLNDQKAFPGRERLNLVFMGMGEPLLNFDNFMKAVRLLVEGVGIPAARMTVSTAGIVPRIHDLGRETVRPKLAISLNASNDELRNRLMPLNRKWNLEQLLQAAREFPLKNRERLTFEYVLLAGVNDGVENARELLERVRGMRAKVNLIALNPGPGIEFSTPEEKRVLAFQQVLMSGGVASFIRRPRGRDIYAACGQLKRTSN